MRIGGKIGTGVVVLGLVLGTTPAASAAPPENAAPPQLERRGVDTVTLITGDQVSLYDGTVRSVRPGKGREGVTFSRFGTDGHLYVLPNDARRLVATGRLDRRLFDITTLIEFGYDDAHRDTVPLIVTHADGMRAPRAGTTSRELPSINGTATTADKSGAAWEALTDGGVTRTAAAGVETVWLDGIRKSTLDHSAAQIGAPTAWAAGITGTGVKVAVLDTGVDQTHPDLADREIAEANFSDAPDNTDLFGHGTHVASIVAGTGARSGGKYRGIAPGASILDGKVLNDSGGGSDSGIIAGMEWAARQGADIANLSLGWTDTTAVDPVEQAVESLTNQYGILFVISAGNSGPYSHSVGSPGVAPSALTVGAVDREDALAEFSSRGPTEVNGAIKPDITGPGVGIVAALHSAGTIGPPVEPGYTALSGTSMAAPHVAGAAALLAQQHPDWTGQQLKATLSASAKPTPGAGELEQGAGRVDVTRALGQTVVSEPTNLNLGIVAWPHHDDQPVRQTLTYRNTGAAAVTLDLAVDSDVISLSTDEITVPAGGTAEVTVTGDVAATTTDGPHTATIVATAGDSVTRTPVVVTREVESYDLTLNYADEHGQPTADASPILFSLDSDRIILPYDADGSMTVRVPKGRWLADHLVRTEGGTRTNLIAQPGLLVDRDRTVDIDPTIARPVGVTPPAPATLVFGDVGYQVESDGRVAFGGLLAFDFSAVSTAQLGDPLPGTTITGWVNTPWAGEDGSFYGLTWFFDDYPTGFTKAVKQRELATVRANVGPGAPGDRAVAIKIPQPRSGDAGVFVAGLDAPLPGTHTAYVTTSGVRWQSIVLRYGEGFALAGQLGSPLRTYRAGRTYDERFNYPVFGPVGATSPWAVRVADTISVNIPLWGDNAGNEGFSALDSATTKLYLGDTLVGETPVDGFGQFADLPAGAGEYRLSTSATRSYPLTSGIDGEWRFRSSHVDGQAALPLNVVRFLPSLDADGSAPAGRRFSVPLRVLDETGAAFHPRTLTVEASYDEGTTWRRVPVTHDLVARLTHPAGAESVSLRASATDRDGNTVRLTIIRAYLLR